MIIYIISMNNFLNNNMMMMSNKVTSHASRKLKSCVPKSPFYSRVWRNSNISNTTKRPFSLFVLTSMAVYVSKSYYESFQFQPNFLKLLTCYVPSRSKTWFSQARIPRFPDFQTAPALGAGETLTSRSRTLPTHPGWKYSCKGNPCC